MSVAGVWETVVKAPNGDQNATLTLHAKGDELTGTYVGPQGSLEVKDGRVDGNAIKFAMDMTQPVALSLSVSCLVNGDEIQGTVAAGQFGDLPLTGVRKKG